MKKYFVCTDYWCPTGAFNRFFFGVIEADLTKDQLIDVVRREIETIQPGVIGDETIIKVTAFNNVEI